MKRKDNNKSFLKYQSLIEYKNFPKKIKYGFLGGAEPPHARSAQCCDRRPSVFHNGLRNSTKLSKL